LNCGTPSGNLRSASLGEPMSFRILVSTALLFAMAHDPRALAQFENRSSVLVNGSSIAISVVVGDFNGDGIPDLADINGLPTTGGVNILLGNGDGTFRAGATYIVGTFLLYGATASLRHNGILDLVFNDMLNDDVWVMLGNGDGTFQPAVAYPTTAETFMIALGKFTDSGNVDVATIEGHDTNGVDCSCVEVLPGNGDGTFGAPITTTQPYGLTAYAITAGDFNDDGKLDVAVVGEAFPSYEVAILLGNGDGTFSADGDYLVSETPTAMTTGYFTGSRKRLDLAVLSGVYSSLSVLLGDGNGTFKESVYYDVSFPGGVAAQDFSGDGKIDLAVTELGPPPQQQPSVAIFKGNGNGTFRSPVLYPFYAGFIESGDFNGDGKPDLVGVGGNPSYITVLLNTGVVTFSPTTPLNFKKQTVGSTSPPQTVTLTNTGGKALRIASMKASAEFAVTSTCGASVAAGGKCTISVTFSPTQKGAKQGTISIIDSASSKQQVIELMGTGT
jgi:hypothetical protein